MGFLVLMVNAMLLDPDGLLTSLHDFDQHVKDRPLRTLDELVREQSPAT
jgi:hypothetical protein